MAAFNPGTSPPPVRTPMCMPSVGRLGLDRGVGRDAELLVVRILGERIDMKALDEQHAAVADEARRGGEPDLVVDFSPKELGARAFLQLREEAEPEGKVVHQLCLDLDELPVPLVHPGPPCELLEDPASPRRGIESRAGLERQHDSGTPVESLAADDPEPE